MWYSFAFIIQIYLHLLKSLILNTCYDSIFRKCMKNHHHVGKETKNAFGQPVIKSRMFLEYWYFNFSPEVKIVHWNVISYVTPVGQKGGEKKQNKWVFRMRSYTGIRCRGKILGEKVEE